MERGSPRSSGVTRDLRQERTKESFNKEGDGELSGCRGGSEGCRLFPVGSRSEPPASGGISGAGRNP